MNITIIGAGNIGSTLAQSLLKAGHEVLIGARLPLSEKSQTLAARIGVERFAEPASAVRKADVIIVAAPATATIEVARSLGDTSGKVIIDTMNTVMGRGAPGFPNTSEAILANTATRDVVKCFNTTGFENLANPQYPDGPLDMFVAGSSARGKAIAEQLACDIGFGRVYDFGDNTTFSLIEQFALCWINLAIFRKEGRQIAFRVTKR